MIFECEKLVDEDDDGPFIKLIIFIIDQDSATVSDITHHNTEQEADEWLATQWKVACPPPIGIRHRFESQS